MYQLESLSVRFREERPAHPITVPTPPKENRPLRERGATLYAKLLCARCHGEEGAGNGAAARAYERTGDRQVRARDFTRGRFIRGAEMEDLYLTLRTGLDGTPMGAYDTLRDDEIWAVAAYVRSLVRERPLYELPRLVPTPRPMTYVHLLVEAPAQILRRPLSTRSICTDGADRRPLSARGPPGPALAEAVAQMVDAPSRLAYHDGSLPRQRRRAAAAHPRRVPRAAAPLPRAARPRHGRVLRLGAPRAATVRSAATTTRRASSRGS